MNYYFGNLDWQHFGVFGISHVVMHNLIIKKINLSMAVGIIHRTQQIRRIGKRQLEKLCNPKLTAAHYQYTYKKIPVERGDLVKNGSHIHFIFLFISDCFFVCPSLLKL